MTSLHQNGRLVNQWLLSAVVDFILALASLLLILLTAATDIRTSGIIVGQQRRLLAISTVLILEVVVLIIQLNEADLAMGTILRMILRLTR